MVNTILYSDTDINMWASWAGKFHSNFNVFPFLEMQVWITDRKKNKIPSWENSYGSVLKCAPQDRVAVANNSILGFQDFYCEQRNLKEKDA